MMKKNCFLMLLIVGVAFIFIGNVEADENDRSCSASSLNELRKQAANIKISYVPDYVTQDSGGTDEDPDASFSYRSRVLNIKIYNMTSKLYIEASADGNSIDKVKRTLTFDDLGPDGSITIRQYAQPVVVNYTFKIYSDAYGCALETLRTVRLSLPRYNQYSRLNVCEDIPEYYLCQEFTTYVVDGSTFYSKVEDYKEKLASQKDENGEIQTDNTGIISKAVSTISKYKYVFVGIVVAAGVIVTVLILKRKKSVS